MWMHNGNLGGWKYIKRALADSLADKWYLSVRGGTDSEWAFALFLDLMEREGGVDPSSAPEGGFGHALLRDVMGKTIRKINDLVAAIPKSYGMTDVETRSLLNFAVTDGHTVVCTRYVSSKTDEAASLYFSSGTKWKEGRTDGHFKMERHDKGADIVLVASEPLTFERRKTPHPSRCVLGSDFFFFLFFLANKLNHRQLGNCTHEFNAHNPKTKRFNSSYN